MATLEGKCLTCNRSYEVRMLSLQAQKGEGLPRWPAQRGALAASRFYRPSKLSSRPSWPCSDVCRLSSTTCTCRHLRITSAPEQRQSEANFVKLPASKFITVYGRLYTSIGARLHSSTSSTRRKDKCHIMLFCSTVNVKCCWVQWTDISDHNDGNVRRIGEAHGRYLFITCHVMHHLSKYIYIASHQRRPGFFFCGHSHI